MARPLKADKSRKAGKKANGKGPKATDGKAAEATPQAGHNARADVRASIQLTAFKNLWEADVAIKAAIEKHVAPLREEKNSLWKNLKNDLDAKAADLKPLYDLYKRDRELANFVDDEEAKKSQDMLREGFETLRVGETLDFLRALGGRQAEPEPISTKQARAAGRQAGQAGKPGSDNPHGEGSDLYAAWNEGHLEGMAENLPAQADEPRIAH